MQQVVRLFRMRRAKEVGVELLHLFVVVRLANLHLAVDVEDRLAALHGVRDVGFLRTQGAAAIDATAGAGHHFDEIEIRRAVKDRLDQLACAFQTVAHGDLDLAVGAAEIDGG